MAAVHHKQSGTGSNPLETWQKGLMKYSLLTRLEKFCVKDADEKENRQFWM
jgi:hypothetical protein